MKLALITFVLVTVIASTIARPLGPIEIPVDKGINEAGTDVKVKGVIPINPNSGTDASGNPQGSFSVSNSQTGINVGGQGQGTGQGTGTGGDVHGSNALQASVAGHSIGEQNGGGSSLDGSNGFSVKGTLDGVNIDRNKISGTLGGSALSSDSNPVNGGTGGTIQAGSGCVKTQTKISSNGLKEATVAPC